MPTVRDIFRHLMGILPRSPKVEGSDRHLIDYAHLKDGVLYHGTVSDLDGSPKSTWTYEDGGRKVCRDQPIDQQTFDLLWRGVAGFAQVQRYLPLDPQTPLDPTTHHVVGLAFDQNGREEAVLFLIPADESDAGFVQWLAALKVPQGSV
jgi:hypothetical protein